MFVAILTANLKSVNLLANVQCAVCTGAGRDNRGVHCSRGAGAAQRRGVGDRLVIKPFISQNAHLIPIIWGDHRLLLVSRF